MGRETLDREQPAMTDLSLAPNDAAALLRWYVEQGLDETIGEEAIDRFALPPPAAAVPVAPAAAPAGPAAAAPQAPTPLRPAAILHPRPPVPLESPQLVEDAREVARQATSIAELEAAVRAFEGCALKRTAKNTVFADGVVGSPVMIVGEAPGADEDRLGKPFVGVSGQLMDRMFDAIGMSRERDLYITNILFWRPPGNRTPTLAEQAICLAFTRRHIELARPKLLVLAGGTAVKAVLDTTEGITRLRGKWTTLSLDDGTEVPTLPTFHPAYLLRTPASKRQSWWDLLSLQKRLKELAV
jgi:uracil-DNA glycosylase family 4